MEKKQMKTKKNSPQKIVDKIIVWTKYGQPTERTGGILFAHHSSPFPLAHTYLSHQPTCLTPHAPPHTRTHLHPLVPASSYSDDSILLLLAGGQKDGLVQKKSLHLFLLFATHSTHTCSESSSVLLALSTLSISSSLSLRQPCQ